MAILVGVILAAVVCGFATIVGLDRDRAFYPTVTIVIASYYALSRFYDWSRETGLIQHGEKIEAEVMGWAPDMDAPKGKVVSVGDAVDLRYTYKGQTYRPYGVLGGRTAQSVTRTAVPSRSAPATSKVTCFPQTR